MPPKRGGEGSDIRSQREEKKGRELKYNEKPAAIMKQYGDPCCNYRSPGPKYKLKNVFGEIDHCPTIYKNPAWSFTCRAPYPPIAPGPGPKYCVNGSNQPAFTFGLAYRDIFKCPSPGPKYCVPPIKDAPCYSMKWRFKYPINKTPGPFSVCPSWDGPCFTLYEKLPISSCSPGPGPTYPAILTNIYKPKAPEYTQKLPYCEDTKCKSPGPKYCVGVKHLKTAPCYTFRIKHSECARYFVNPCDKICQTD